MNLITKNTVDKLNEKVTLREECFLEKSKDNKNVFSIIKDGRSIYLGSKYSVGREIDKTLNEIEDIDTQTVVVVFGLGTGEHILELLKRTENNKIIIIEPNVNVINEFLKIEYSKEIIEEDRVYIEKYEKDMVGEFLSSCINMIEVRNLKYLIFANYSKVFNQEYVHFTEELKIFLYDNIIKLNTVNVFSEEFLKNYMNNLSHIMQGKRINQFKKAFNGCPAVVVSAGPSLEKNIDQLKAIQDNVFIITGGRTLGPLLKKGIKPDLVCVVDPAIEAYQIMENDMENDVPMVFCEYTFGKVVNEYKGKKIYFPQESVKEITEDLIGVKTDTLLVGGSVAHVCTSVAEYIGCEPIVFIGQDLAYTNNKHHADIADTLEGEEMVGMDVIVEDIYGDKVGTTYVLNSFRKDLERNIKSFKDSTFINSTEGGANIEGTIVMPLKECIEKYCEKPIEKDMESIFKKSSGINKEEVKNKISEIASVLRNVEKQSKIGVKESLKMITSYTTNNKGNINIILRKLDKVDKEITKARGKRILDSLLSPVIIDVMTSKKYVEKLNETEKETGVRVANRSKRLYEGILNAAEEGRPFVTKCINEIDKIEEKRNGQ